MARRLSFLPAALLGLVIGLSPAGAQNTDQPVVPAGEAAPVLVIGLDLSKSNPMVSNDAYARRVADRVAPMVEEMPLRGRVMVRSFGSYDATSNTLRIDQVLTARATPEDFARGLKTLISGVPKLVRDGKPIMLISIRQNNNKFFTAIARHEITPFNTINQRLRHKT